MSETTTVSASTIVRAALRKAVRTHAEYSVTKHGDVSRMSKGELNAACHQLGIDRDAVVKAAMADVQAHTAAGSPAPAPRQRPAAPAADATPAPGATAEPTEEEILATISGLREDILDKGFGSVASRLAELVRAAAKPPVVVEVERAPTLPAGAHAIRAAETSTWGRLFGVTGGAAAQPVTVWDHPQAPKVNPLYVFPSAETAIALGQMARSEAARAKGAPAKHVLMFGPAGTGKSAWAKQFAAVTRRPFVCLSLNDGVEMEQLLGQELPDGTGKTVWRDGLLLNAIRQPGMVICLDEVGGMRPAVGVALNSLLQDMEYYVPDTGERVRVAKNVIFIATNNANLSESGAARGYVGITRQNKAFADRFGVSIEIDYAPAAVETQLLTAYTGCTPELAQLLVGVATLSRGKAKTEELTGGIGFRRLLAWAETLTDGVDAEHAFKAAVLNTAPQADVEVLRQLALVAMDPTAIARACAPAPAAGPGAPAPSHAGRDFPASLFGAR